MQDRPLDRINIALVGGEGFCKEVLEKIVEEYKRDMNAQIVAVAHPDPQSPGRILAEKLGLKTFDDYHELYDSLHAIDLITILTPNQSILDDVLATKPSRIRLLSYQTFSLFWGAMMDRAKEIETVLNGIEDNILVIAPDMTIMDVNEPFLKQMNYSREEVIGKKCHEVFQKINRICSNNIYCPLKEAIKTQSASQRILTRLDHEGKTRYIEVTIFPIWEKPGKILKFIEISRDVTQRKKEEEEITTRLEKMVEERTRELKETYAKLLHQDKMVSLGKLSASVVHEINNPNAGILNLILLMKRIISDDGFNQKNISKISQYLNLMETETRRISRIVSNLLTFSRQSKVDLEYLNANQLIEKTLLLNLNLLKINNVRVEKKLATDLPEIYGSEDQLLQVFMNIISNAVEAVAPKGSGRLTIETRKKPENDSIVVLFSDTGIGITDANIPNLFEPFFTTKKKSKGVGLGLSVVYGIIEDYHGSIHVSSKVGEGTTFTIEFPLKF